MNREILSANITESDQDLSLRPGYLQEFIGQEGLKNNLSVFIQAAKNRQEPLDHTIFYGPPGLGKTSLAKIVAKELGVNFKTTAGPALSKAADLAAILTNLQKNDVLFIDEIHRLSISVEEILYSAMEDFTLDIVIGEGPSARSVRIDLPRFTLVGATTRLGLVSNPLRDRFGIPLRLDFYTPPELTEVVLRASKVLKTEVTICGAEEIAKRARGTPRIALRLLRRVRDFASIGNFFTIDRAVADNALTLLDIDLNGLDSNDYRYLRFIKEHYSGGPVGVETIAAALSEQKDAIEDTIEPYLIQIGFVQRTPRGRVLSLQAISYLSRPLSS